jgi:hypothetical protein
VLTFPSAQDALAELASEEAEVLWLLVKTLPAIWGRALAQEYVRSN